jgi:hypothetical protein
MTNEWFKVQGLRFKDVARLRPGMRRRFAPVGTLDDWDLVGH